MASQTGKFCQTWFWMTETIVSVTQTIVSVAQTMVSGTQTLVSVTLTIVSHPKQSFMFGNHGFPTGTELFWENIVRGSQTMFCLTLTMVSHPKQSFMVETIVSLPEWSYFGKTWLGHPKA